MIMCVPAMKKEANMVSLGDIARVAGVSVSAVSLALQNKPGIGRATREKIISIAKELGYAADARLSSLMAKVRVARSKELLPIAWLNTSWEKDSWHRYGFHAPYLKGACERAHELGYKIEEIWCHAKGMTMKRLSKILYHRGIEGVIVTFPARHFRLEWDHLASISIGESLMAPKLHRVAADANFNLQLALKSLKRLGYRRIGICMPPGGVNSSLHYSVRATARDLYFSSSRAERIPPLFQSPYWTKNAGKEKEMIDWLKSHMPEVIAERDNRLEIWAEATGFSKRQNEKDVVSWIKRHKPEVIVGHDNRLVEWAEKAGFRVPEDLGIVHFAVDDDVLDWAGIHSRRRQTGAAAVDFVVSLMRNHQFGVPETPLTIFIRGTWQTGRTLRRKAKG
jgi:LacI family transcriptional regulator